jgi:carbonic anhydrase
MKKLIYSLIPVFVSMLFITACGGANTSTESNVEVPQAQSEDRLSLELRDSMTPQEVLQAFKDGHQRFLDGNLRVRKFVTEINETSMGQNPYAIVVSCIDSRVPVETIFDKRIGEIFSSRLAGNVINTDVVGGVEFATALAGAKLVLVMGHTSCGAVKGAIADAEYGNLTGLLDKIKPADDSVRSGLDPIIDTSSEAYTDMVATKHVELSLKQLRDMSPELVRLEQEGKIIIVGAMYDIASGAVTFID